MCGFIAAFTDSDILEPSIRVAMQKMLHRGPDGEGFWQEGGVYLGHRRLAILDLDQRASQPMKSACGRYAIVFNGEIYNFHDLRDKLARQGWAFRTTSDTEVILTLFAAHGPAMLPMLHGMFALVIWDRVARRAFAARDPYGIKPLYVAATASGILFASQVKALLATGLVSRGPDALGQAGFWLLGSVPEPRTWYQDIRAIPAGHYAWVEGDRKAESVCWSDIGTAWRGAPVSQLSDTVVRDRVRTALRESIRRHLVADVPVGVFLSGGIDSGALAGLMVEAGAKNVAGITIAFDEFSGSHQDEAPVAAAIAAHYGIRHHVRRISQEEFVADLPRILEAMDQPSIDGINTWYASKAVAELGLKVVVSGVGGDELFQGYGSFQQLPRLVAGWRILSQIPGMKTIGGSVGSLQALRSGNSRWKHAAQWATTIGGAWWLRRSLFAPEDLPRLMGAQLASEALHGFEATQWVREMSGALPADNRLALGQIESSTYLRNQLLRDSDWASMDHSVELRTPLVDAHLLHQLQPLLSNFARFPKKTLLAEAPEKPLPHSIIHRQKTGFGIPIARWMAAHLQDGKTTFNSREWGKYLVDFMVTKGLVLNEGREQ